MKELTPEQEKLMVTTKDKWLNNVFGKWEPINLEAAVELVYFLYELGSLSKPEVKFYDSPMAIRKELGDCNFAYNGGVSDYGWVAFYDFFDQIGALEHEGFRKYRDLLFESKVYDMVQLRDTCYVTAMPVEIHRDAEHRLHNDKGPAVRFKDDEEMFFWKGIAVPRKFIMEPDTVTKSDLNEDNAETRRCYIEILGVDKYFSIMGDGDKLTVVDADTDNQGQEMRLLQFLFEGEEIQCLEVVCPSTERVYNLYPPNQQSSNVWEAKASTFGLKQQDFDPIIET